MSKSKTYDGRSLEMEMALEAGRDAINGAIDTLQRAVKELRYHLQDFNNDTIDATGKAKRVNWCMTHLTSNVLGNCRLDLMADAQARILRAHDAIKEAR
jgi:hypothetical protein